MGFPITPKRGCDSWRLSMRIALSTLVLIVIAALLQIPTPKVTPAVKRHHYRSLASHQNGSGFRQSGRRDHKHGSVAENGTATKKANEDTEINRSLVNYTRALVVVGAIQCIALLENINGSFYLANFGASLTEIREVHCEPFIGEKLPPELEAHLKRLN